MTRKIHLLSEAIINQIAAGEVIERPASVLKELVENAVDAEADEIHVAIEKAGKELLQVIDNGVGMTDADARTAFERHATSKLYSLDQLEEIASLGFRGEALASIAAVSKVQLRTRTGEEELGSELQMEAGRLLSQQRIRGKKGTSMAVRHLFFNTPARRRFLKSDATELMHLQRWFIRLALSKPQITFSYEVDGKSIHHWPGGSLQERATQVFDRTFPRDYYLVDSKQSGMRLFGWVAKPSLARSDRRLQYLFLNGRAIRNRSINYAVFTSFGQMLPAQSYPPFLLYLQLETGMVDVNVHPSKEEVRFAREKELLVFVQQSVTKAMEASGELPELSERHRGSGNENPFAGLPPEHAANAYKQGSEHQYTLAYRQQEIDSEENQFPTQSRSVSRPIWQVLQRYLVAEVKDALLLIDQYRAHYRILYDRIRAKATVAASQALLFPLNIDLEIDDYVVFEKLHAYFLHAGFAIDKLSGNSISVTGVPADIRPGFEHQIVPAILRTYRNDYDKQIEAFDRFARAFARNNAVRAGASLAEVECVNLVDDLFACKQNGYTPDGKPIWLRVEANEIERRLK
jgi:DNA mismatch repair protein MutL